MGAYLQFPIPRKGVARVLELGSRDGADAKLLRDAFSAEVVAWECNPSSIARCRKTFATDGAGLRLVEAAAWNEPGEISFYPVVNGNYGASSCFEANHEYPFERPYQQTRITVPAKRVDDDCAEHDWWPDLMCVDLQGAELAAFGGCEKALTNARHLVTEVQHIALYLNTPLLPDITAALAAFGFHLRDIKNVNTWFGDAWFAK